VGEIAARLGTRAFLVGGPVRDLLLGLRSPDLDIAVEARARQFCHAVGLELHGRAVFHSRFLSGTVTTSAGVRLDINQTRTETYRRPAALPTVSPADIEADLSRRDFSVNAMALGLSPSEFGRLYDPLDARHDLSLHRLRVLHDASFDDDPTRAFRCLRFAVRLGFEVEPHTLDLLRRSVQQRIPALLTPERVLYELRLVCREPRLLWIAEALLRERVLQATWDWTPPRRFLPELGRLVRHSISPELLFIYWLSLLPVTDRFPITSEERNASEWLRRFEPVCGRLCRSTRASTIYRLLRPIPEPALRLLAVLEPEVSACRIREYLDRLVSVRTEVTGKDLRRMGVEPGPRYRRILDHLLYARLDRKVLSRDDELALCRRLLARDHLR
jgi:tRNA nucleotidyltransferase (CCA-adding enzyme)